MCYFGDDYVCYMDDTVGECVVGWQLDKSVRLGRFVDQVMVNAPRVFVSLSVVGLKKTRFCLFTRLSMGFLKNVIAGSLEREKKIV